MIVFTIFSYAVLKERLKWTDGVAMALIFAGVAVAMLGRHVSK